MHYRQTNRQATCSVVHEAVTVLITCGMYGRRARQQQEWEERQAERKARQAEMAGEPFDKEVTLLVLFNRRFAHPAATSTL